MAEGANGALLDVDHGSYPFVTSSNTTAGGLATGLGMPLHSVESLIGVVKAYTTRVGSGPFPTELHDQIGEHLQVRGGEVGVTTGRKRRCGWLDLKILRRSLRVNGYHSIMLTKLDVLDELREIQVKLEDGSYKVFPGWREDISRIRVFGDLPQNCQNYVLFIEEYLGVPIT